MSTLFWVYNYGYIYSQPNRLGHKVLTKILERVCGMDQSGGCLTSFVSWYMNQWGLTNRSQFNEVKVKIVCDNLVSQKVWHIRQVGS